MHLGHKMIEYSKRGGSIWASVHPEITLLLPLSLWKLPQKKIYNYILVSDQSTSWTPAERHTTFIANREISILWDWLKIVA